MTVIAPGATSALGKLILWVHEQALRARLISTVSRDADQVLDGIQGRVPEFGKLSEAQIAGLELRSGRPQNDIAKTIQRRAVRYLQSVDAALGALDAMGYTPTVIRGLLQHHYSTLAGAAIGSDAHLVYVDLATAIEKASEKTREVVLLLVAGYSPQEIGVKLQTNGSRRIGRAMSELSRILEGRQ